MRFLKSMRAPGAAENAALAERLSAITNRGRVELSSYPVLDEPSEPQGMQRIFWTPDELAAESSGG